MIWPFHRRDHGLMAAGCMPRSPHWPIVRATHLAAHPACEACGNTRSPDVHHIRPYHVEPALELDPANLMTLCRQGVAGMDCHLYFGHGGNWSDYVPTAPQDAPAALARVQGRVRA